MKMVVVPRNCLVCGDKYLGGHELPDYPMREGLRVFYRCGASMSVKILDEGVYQILFKNCQATQKEKDD